MVKRMRPPKRPTITRDETNALASAYGVDVSRPWILGCRGHWRDSMGEPGKNDRNYYDDAVFLITPEKISAFMFNTDAGRVRRGYGKSESKKGMAMLKPGLHWYKRGVHRGKYKALVQARPVTVIRDGNPDYEDTGWFGINHHAGGESTTSSLGCQTVPPDQYWTYYNAVDRAMNEHALKEIPYLLVDRQGK